MATSAAWVTFIQQNLQPSSPSPPPTPVAATRERIAAALFQIVTTTVGNVVGLKTSARRRVMPENVSASQTPALFQVQTEEKYERGPAGSNPKRTMLFEMLLYTTDDASLSAGLVKYPSTQLNAMVQALETAFNSPNVSSAVTGAATLNGLVYWARIEGTIAIHETPILGGLSIAVVPIVVTVP